MSDKFTAQVHPDTTVIGFVKSHVPFDSGYRFLWRRNP